MQLIGARHYCEMEGAEGKLSTFLDSFGEPTGAETYRDALNLVVTAREIVLALDGFDPEFCVVPRPLVENLKVKLAPFETVR